MALLAWTSLSDIASAQHVNVEWLQVDDPAGPYLVLNAYPSSDSSRSDQERLLEEADVAAVVQPLPIRKVAGREVLDPFLRRLGIDGLDAVGPSTASLSDFDRWRQFVDDLQQRAEMQVGAAVISSRQVSPERRRTYAAQGFPTSERPVFPHLVRGVLAVLEEENAADSFLVRDLGSVELGTHYTVVRFANVGSRPLKVYAGRNFFSGARLVNLDVTLDPGEDSSVLLRFESTPLSLLTGRGGAEVAYESMGSRRAVLGVRAARRSSLGAVLRSGLQGLASGHARFWDEIPLYRFALLIVAAGSVMLLASMMLWFRKAGLSSDGILRTLGASIRSRYTLQGLAVPTFPKLRMPSLGSLQPRLGRLPDVLRSPFDQLSKTVRTCFARTTELVERDTGRSASLRFRSMGLRAAARLGRFVPCVSRVYPFGAPASPALCVERLERLVGGEGAERKMTASASSMRREVVYLAHRLDADLRRERVRPTVENFQFLWSLRDLAASLKENPAAAPTLEQWVASADTYATASAADRPASHVRRRAAPQTSR